MSIVNNENVLKILYSYNPWWTTGTVQKNLNKPKRRFAYYEANQIFLHKDIRRTVLLSGARRVGKTTIIYQTINDLIEQKHVSHKDIMFVSFDHPLLKMCSIESVIDVYQKNISSNENVYCFFDEVQYASDWNSWMKILYDTMPNVRVMATGSASPMIIDKVSESGLGRWKVVQVPTLSFFEYYDFLNLEPIDLPKGLKPTQLYQLDHRSQMDIFMKLGKLQTHFLRYLQVGGFPELALSKDDIYAQRILREDIVDKALKRDLPALYGIRNVSDIEKVFLFLCYHSSNLINIELISKELSGVSRNTIERYISHLENANLIYVSPPIDLGGKKVLKQQNKIYISDAAMRNAVLMYDDISTNPEELGIVVETAVYKHVKTFYYEDNSVVGYFRKSSRENEIDIVVRSPKRQQDIMIEVKYREQVNMRETDAVVAMSGKKQPNLVITKRDNDFGLTQVGEKQVYKMPACAFLYLLGFVENENLKRYLQ